jgi:anti-sigma factor RsiW
MTTTCTECGNLLAGYDELAATERARVDAHVAQCAACSALAQALADLGPALGAEYGDVSAPPTLRGRVSRRLSPDLPPKPSPLPAILDMLAWSAVACAVGMLAWFVAPAGFTLTGTMLYATAGVLTLGELGITLWVVREREE